MTGLEKNFSKTGKTSHGVKPDSNDSFNDEDFDDIEDKLLDEDREKRKEKMIVEGRSVFNIQKKKEKDNEHNRH